MQLSAILAVRNSCCACKEYVSQCRCSWTVAEYAQQIGLRLGDDSRQSAANSKRQQSASLPASIRALTQAGHRFPVPGPAQMSTQRHCSVTCPHLGWLLASQGGTPPLA